MIAVANNDQVIRAVVGELDNDLARMPTSSLAADSDAVLAGGLFNFLLALLEIFVRRFGFPFEFAGQIRMARQRLAHPKRGELSVALFGHLGGAAQGSFAPF